MESLDAQYFETMRWDTLVPNRVRTLTERAARYTTRNGFDRITLAFKITATEIDAFIDEEVASARADGVNILTIRSHGRDAPAGLREVLRAKRFGPVAGFVEESPSIQHFLSTQTLLDNLRAMGARSGFEARELTQASEIDDYLPIWQESFPGQEQRRYVDECKAIVRSGELGVRYFAVYDGTTPISSGYMYHSPGAPMALLCGGATRTAWRKRGAYLALIAKRAQVAMEAGVQTLCVDASPHSAPILQRLGFVPNDTVIFYEIKLSGDANAA